MSSKALHATNIKGRTQAGGETVETNVMKKSKEYIEQNVDCTR